MEERTPAAVDQDVLDELEHSVGDDRAFLRDLVETYLEDSPRLIGEIRAGISVGDVQRTNRAAHTLKSTSASLGALGLSALARELETLTSVATTQAEDLASPEIGALVNVIRAEFEEVQIELDRLVPSAEN